VRHPITEHEAYDAFVRVHEHGDDYGWDGDRLSIGGPSSGSQAAFSVVAQAIDAGGYRPIAVSSEFGVAEISRPDDTRTSSRKRPAVSQRLMRLVKSTYFAGADLTDPLVSPAHSPRLGEFPPTLILTAELDTLRDEMTDSEGSHMSDSTPTASTTTSSASSRTPRSAA
jgi:acetyl esterase